MKTFAVLLMVFLIYSTTSFAQDTSLAVSSSGNVGIGTAAPASKLDVNGTMTISGANTNELNRSETGDANLVPIAYANVNSDGTINTGASTDNVTLSSHSAGSGNYYFAIAGESVNYTDVVCIATLNGSPGLISWGSSGGGTVLYIGTADNTGTSTDLAFTFIIYKK
jgi:hypothetical protein